MDVLRLNTALALLAGVLSVSVCLLVYRALAATVFLVPAAVPVATCVEMLLLLHLGAQYKPDPLEAWLAKRLPTRVARILQFIRALRERRCHHPPVPQSRFRDGEHLSQPERRRI